MNALGTEINHLRKTANDALLIIGYFDARPDVSLVRAAMHNALRIYGLSADSIQQIEHKLVENTDWLDEWKKHWKPAEISRFIIAPPWEKVGKSGKIVIFIEPNMAFGTGTHETTQLCLKAIGERYKPGQSFLDVGTGTGILAIAAAKLATEDTEKKSDLTINSPEGSGETSSVLSVAEISACDTDIDSINIARKNAKLNGADQIDFFVGTISPETPIFDFVCANLTIDVITPILRLLIEKTRETLVLSGILREQVAAIVWELENLKIRSFRIEQAGEWISVAIKNG